MGVMNVSPKNAPAWSPRQDASAAGREISTAFHGAQGSAASGPLRKRTGALSRTQTSQLEVTEDLELRPWVSG